MWSAQLQRLASGQKNSDTNTRFYTFYAANNNGADQTTQMPMLISILVWHRHKADFSWNGSNY